MPSETDSDTQKGRAMAKGILLPVLDFSGMAEDEFNDWYDLEHIPERLRVPGILACQRWIGLDNPKISLATARIKMLMRFEGDQIGSAGAAPKDAPALLVNAMSVATANESEFNESYD